jgi:hypothetical protein
MAEQELIERNIIQVNYWKRIMKDANEVIGNLHGLVLLLHNSVELSDIINFINKIREDDKLSVMLISFINSYERIKETLIEHPLEIKKLYVVDCVTNLIDDCKDDTPVCEYKRPPDNLDQLKDMVMKKIDEKNPNIVVIDSLSQFINFSATTDDELEDFFKFLYNIKQNISGLSKDSIILLYDEKFGPAQNLPVVSLDLVLKLEVFRGKPGWRD